MVTAKARHALTAIRFYLLVDQQGRRSDTLLENGKPTLDIDLNQVDKGDMRGTSSTKPALHKAHWHLPDTRLLQEARRILDHVCGRSASIPLTQPENILSLFGKMGQLERMAILT